jgi:hypothetical protein
VCSVFPFNKEPTSGASTCLISHQQSKACPELYRRNKPRARRSKVKLVAITCTDSYVRCGSRRRKILVSGNFACSCSCSD